MDKYLNRTPPNDGSSSSKRMKLENLDSPVSQTSLRENTPSYNATEVCTYGEKCYRRNIHHFKEYRHPHLEQLLQEMTATNNMHEFPKTFTSRFDKDVIMDQIDKLKAVGFVVESKSSIPCSSGNASTGGSDNSIPSIITLETDKLNTSELKSNRDASTPTPEKKIPRVKQMSNLWNPLEKWEASSPFNMFLTSIGPERSFFSMGFTDLFHPSFGKIQSICHINFMVEMDWLGDQMIASKTWGTPTTVIYGTENPGLVQATTDFEWMRSYRMKSPHTFGHHHSKMTLILYEDSSVRFIVYTANLIESDWMNKTQGMWVSPSCPPLGSTSDGKKGESQTNFRADMINYLITYQLKDMENWLKVIGNSDCSEIKVVFVASAPVLSQAIGNNGFRWGIKKVETVLRKHLTAPVNSQWPIIAQCSSVGSLGPDDSWLKNEWGSLLDGPTKTKPQIKFVYPSYKDVVNSAQGEEGADCLPYSNMVHCKQKWIEGIMCNWVGFRYNRTYALPHIKTYCRVSPDSKQMAWYILTSANLSKAAWGKLNKNRDNMIVMSWECGVMFLPKFLTGTGAFEGEISEIDNGSLASSRLAMDRQTIGYPFPIPYDLPVTPYSGASKPWLVDYLNRPRRGRPS